MDIYGVYVLCLYVSIVDREMLNGIRILLVLYRRLIIGLIVVALNGEKNAPRAQKQFHSLLYIVIIVVIDLLSGRFYIHGPIFSSSAIIRVNL